MKSTTFDIDVPVSFRGSKIGHELVSPRQISRLLLETIRTFFLSVDNFTTYEMRNRDPALLWSENDNLTGVRIVRNVDWELDNQGKAPEIVISNAPPGTAWNFWNKEGNLGGQGLTVDGRKTVNDAISSRFLLWCVSPVADEAWDLGWELGLKQASFG